MKCANPKCGKEFEPKSKNQKCCCNNCAVRYYQARHKEECKANAYYWKKRNPDKLKEYGRRWYSKHREGKLMKMKLYYITGEWPKGKSE